MLLRPLLFLSITMVLTGCLREPVVDAQQQPALQKEAASIVQQFVATLKPKLKKALREGGPAHAVAVCSKTAPTLAIQLGDETGWSIKRVSLKARNHQTAIPDAWESAVLRQFDREQAAGKPVSGMIASHIEKGQYRFMKAQVVEPVCLVCHGKVISPDVTAALKQYYPQDQATGYELGQVRGAFSLSKRL